MFIIGKDYYLFAISFKSYPFRNCFPFSYLYYKFASSNNFWAFEPHLHVCIIAQRQRIRCKPSENNDVYHVCSFYSQDRKDCIANLKLRDTEYEEYEYYFFVIGALDGKYFCLEFKCVSEDIFSDSDSIFMEIDL